MERLERFENKVDRVEERLSLVKESYMTIRAVVEKTDAKADEMAKLGNVWLSRFMLLI